MSKKDLTYCNANRCALKEHCVRYVEGQYVPKDEPDWLWMEDCGEDRIGYIDTDKR